MKALLGPNGDLSFQTRLKDFMWDTLFGNGSNALINEKGLLVPGHYLTSYLGSAHIGVIQQWLDNGRKESPQEMAHILSTITVNGPLYKVCHDCATDFNKSQSWDEKSFWLFHSFNPRT